MVIVLVVHERGALAGIVGTKYSLCEQKESRFYPSWAFVLPTTLMRIPVSILESFLWSIITYWVIGLSAQAGRFFIFWAMGCLVHNMAVSSASHMYMATGAVLSVP